MDIDCGLAQENHWFRYRSGGIIINDDKMLFVRSGIGNYYYMIGGGVHLGETSIECIEREVKEECGLDVEADHLAVVCENFFKGKGGIIDGYDCHTLEFYYVMKVGSVEGLKETTDSGEDLIWLNIDQISVSNIKPSFIRERIGEIIKSDRVIHVIEARDR